MMKNTPFVPEYIQRKESLDRLVQAMRTNGVNRFQLAKGISSLMKDAAKEMLAEAENPRTSPQDVQKLRAEASILKRGVSAQAAAKWFLPQDKGGSYPARRMMSYACLLLGVTEHWIYNGVGAEENSDAVKEWLSVVAKATPDELADFFGKVKHRLEQQNETIEMPGSAMTLVNPEKNDIKMASNGQ